MTPQEVSHILQDPHAVTDSDDEEDDRERSKVRVFVHDGTGQARGTVRLGACNDGYAYALACTDLAAVHDTTIFSHFEYRCI